MPGKRIAIIVLLVVSLGLSGCSMQPNLSSGIEVEREPLTTPENQSLIPIPSSTPTSTDLPQGTVEYTQKMESLPDIYTLTTFPGVLESMSLTLEQLITILGNQFDLFENKAQGYDSYSFPEYNLILDFDKTSEKLSAVWLDNVPYYIYSGAFMVKDLNGDGKPEKIVAYEDQDFNGSLLVLDGADSDKVSMAPLGFFGDKCKLDVISSFGRNKETLILVETGGGRQGDIIRYSGGELMSILPEGYDNFSKEALVTVEGIKTLWVHKKRNILYLCPLPDRLATSVSGRSASEAYRYSIILKPVLSGDSLYLKARTILQLKLSDNYNYIDNTEGTYCDVAQVTVEYQYSGQGTWQETEAIGSPKYTATPVAALLNKDLSVGNLTLFDALETLNPSILKSLSDFTPEELNSSVLLEEDGLRVGITQDRITYLSLEQGSKQATLKGLKISDTREKALSLYGTPDKGFNEDSVWTYYVIREEQSGDEASFFIDSLNLEFESEKVSRIWISAHVTAF